MPDVGRGGWGHLVVADGVGDLIRAVLGHMAQDRFLAVFCSIIAFLLYNFALTTLPSRVAVNILNIVPVAGLLWA